MFSTLPIRSILDTDFYKLSMQQAYLHQTPNAIAEWEFRCRSKEDLRQYQKALIDNIAYLNQLSITEDELNYLKQSFPFLSNDYLHFLRYFCFDPSFVEVKVDKEQLAIKLKGPQVYVSAFEIPLLAALSEIRNQTVYPNIDENQIIQSTKNKISQLQSWLKNKRGVQFKFIDFGTRRRFSYQAQALVIEQLKSILSDNFVGTSNVLMAKMYDIPCVGTMAHEWLQTHQGLNYRLIDHQTMALNNWVKEYRGELGVALTDVIGVDAFCRDLDKYFAKLYDGYRHDSGSPIVWGEKIIQRLKLLDINPKTKCLIFSDSLDFSKATEIYEHFEGRINMQFGIGTWLMGYFDANKPLNMVMKLTRLNEQPVAKISDSTGKTVCRDKSYLAYLMRTFQVEESKQAEILAMVEED